MTSASAIAAYHYFIAQIAPWLLATAIPSTVVALTKYPKASGFLRGLSYFAQLLSFLTHSDSPGTLKLPLTARFEKPAASPAQTVVALFLAGSFAFGGCAWFQAHPTVTGELKCAGSEILNAIPTVLADVTSALSGGSPDWGALLTLEESHGLDLIACAINAASAPKAGAAVRADVAKNAAAYKAEGSAHAHFAKQHDGGAK